MVDSDNSNDAHLLVSNSTVIDTDEIDTGTSWQMSSLIVTNAALGAGILNFPAAFDTAGGILIATAVHLLLFSLAFASLFTLGWCSNLDATSSFQQTVSSLCGIWPRKLCSLVVTVYCYLICVAFLVVVGDQSDVLLRDKFGLQFCNLWHLYLLCTALYFMYMNRNFVVPMIALPLLLPLCYARNIDFLKYPSGLATIGVFYLAGLTVYIYLITDTFDVVVDIGPDVWSDSLSVVPTIMFGYQVCITKVCSKYVVKVCTKVCIANCVSYLSLTHIAIPDARGCHSRVRSGLAANAEQLHEDDLRFVVHLLCRLHNRRLFRLFNIRHKYSTECSLVLFLIGFTLFAVKNLLTYPILIFCGRLALFDMYVDFRRFDECHLNDDKLERRFRLVASTFWLMSTIGMAIFVPSIGCVVEFLGSLATFFILIFPGWRVAMLQNVPRYALHSSYPGVCLLKASTIFQSMSGTRKQTLFFVGSSFVVIGFFVFGMTLVQSVQLNLQSFHLQNRRRICP